MRVPRSQSGGIALEIMKTLPCGMSPGGQVHLISRLRHERTEEECVEIFDRCKAAFEYVVKKLTEAKREDEAYIEAIRKLSHD